MAEEDLCSRFDKTSFEFSSHDENELVGCADGSEESSELERRWARLDRLNLTVDRLPDVNSSPSFSAQTTPRFGLVWKTSSATKGVHESSSFPCFFFNKALLVFITDSSV
jgi:hypothetical protein